MTAALGALGKLLSGLVGSGSVAQQFFVWGVLQGVVSTATSPFNQALLNKVNADNPETPLSPAALADMVLRGIAANDWATGEAAKSGVNADDFAKQVEASGEPPALEELLSLWRRGKIDDTQLEHGIRQSRVRDEWIPIIKDLGVIPPTPVDMLQAYLEGQIDEATARDLYQKLGGDPDYFTILYNTRGGAPTPLEASDMARRGIIPWDGVGPDTTSYEQAFLEGPWRNKWAGPYRKYADYVPPPRTIVTLISKGTITDAVAADLLAKNGVSADLAAAYIAEGHDTKTSATRDLAASTILALYQDQAIDSQTATGMLEQLRYNADDANWMLLVQDLKREEKYLNVAISKIHSLYVAYKIDESTAYNSLATLEVPTGQISSLKKLWDLERAANVKLLTPAQIANALKYNIVDQAGAQQLLQDQGYQPHDAWTFLSVELHAKLPDEPPPNALT